MYKPTSDLIKRLPKTDLHVHLDGSMRIPTILELAREQHVKQIGRASCRERVCYVV